MINYIKGDATCPQAKGTKIIAHICNNIGGWGRGFVLAVSNRWKEPEKAYRDLKRYPLGTVQLVQVEDWIWVANMIAQFGVHHGSNGPPIRYDALAQCLGILAQEAKIKDASIHMPRIGCGNAGGDWKKIVEIIEDIFLKTQIDVTIYSLE